ncbi:MAG: alpha-amylase family glycosyl hydrolase [Acidobacteriaceae bacterium]
MEFHISRGARDRYEVDASLFSFSGNVIFADVRGSRVLAHRMNQVRKTENDPQRIVNPGALFAMGLIDEASHLVMAYYREHVDPQVLHDALNWFEGQIGADGLNRLLLRFVTDFPGTSVYRGEQRPEVWLAQSTAGTSNREVAFEELLMLWLANANPAFAPFEELFDDAALEQRTPYVQVVAGLHSFFDTRPPIGDENFNLIDLLRLPALVSPDSLSGQLAVLSARWSRIIGADVLRRLLLASDVLKEEDIAIWMRFHPPGGADAQRRARGGAHGQFGGRVDLPDFAVEQHEYENFSQDQDWMPNTVLIAKSTYVWLAQLSKQYGREITRLDQIPDQELDELARRGLNALWLIGLWERSRASRTIKRLCGKEDAVASAYSLYDYQIAGDLGGPDAYYQLRHRAAGRGIRMASDMVPNHMGIDSTWVIEHPEWFLSRPDSPYPSYRFEGPDLSGDGRVEIKIEDHYYEQTDAAVVFQRRDKWTGDTRYVYHGNDGTSFPWNDTAQLDYLNPAVREQVIQTILHVARLSPIIRFDAAMTLAKRHIQRLWFPAPGAGGAIPSRAECSMPTAEFDAKIPVEFWREVVDRVAAEVPGTLLLAEAFWMMEGYFVRTLGMHRVYNSAFMNLLRDEDNAHYRTLLKQTMEFDPGIMKRYVNFMSNPDERTAIDQFGTGDKYFGVATLMSTLPGLPMFGHGQVEGFNEKYGMEYQRPRYDETPNQWLVERHQREIAPLLHQRWLFAESENFLLYDFWKEDGTVDENVYAYSNTRGGERALVLYNNRYGSTRGTLHYSTGFADKSQGGIQQRSLQDGLHLPADGSLFFGIRDVSNGLEYLRRASDLVGQGFFFELQAYKYHVFLHWRELRVDAEHAWDRLHDRLGGGGIPSLDEGLLQLKLQPLHDVLIHALDPPRVRALIEFAESTSPGIGPVVEARARLRTVESELIEDFVSHAAACYDQARTVTAGRPAEGSAGSDAFAEEVRSTLRAALCLPELERNSGTSWPVEARTVLPTHSPATHATAVWAPVLGWCLAQALTTSLASPAASAVELFDGWRLRQALASLFEGLGLDDHARWRASARVRILIARADRNSGADGEILTEEDWAQGDIRWLTGLHDADGCRYVIKEQFEQLLWWTQLPALLHAAQAGKPGKDAAKLVVERVRSAANAMRDAGYKPDVLLQVAGAVAVCDAATATSNSASTPAAQVAAIPAAKGIASSAAASATAAPNKSKASARAKKKKST